MQQLDEMLLYTQVCVSPICGLSPTDVHLERLQHVIKTPAGLLLKWYIK